MEFSPNNPIVRLCIQGMDMEAQHKNAEAARIFTQAWNEADNDFGKFLAAYYLSRHQQTEADKLKWMQTSLTLASKINDVTVNAALPSLHAGIAKCYEALNDRENARKHYDLADSYRGNPADPGPFYHGTRADLKPGDVLKPGFNSNYKDELRMNHIYFTALANGAGLAAALAKGEERERVYVVEPMGHFEHDPNVTDKKFPGNLTRSYRTGAPLKVIGELSDWVKQSPEQIRQWRERLANNKGEIIN